MTCRGCHNRLRLPVGTSGHCNPCYLAERVQRVVQTRYPPAKAEELTHYLAKVLNTLEADTEAFESGRTSGVVDIEGYLVEVRKVEKAKLPPKLAAGAHPGERDPRASSASGAKKEKEPEATNTPENPSRHRRRRREEKTKSRSRSRRRERKKVKKEPTPEPEEEEVATQEEAEVEEAEAEAEVETEEKDDEDIESPRNDEASPDTEVAIRCRGVLVHHPGHHRDTVIDDLNRRRSGKESCKHIIRGQTLGYSEPGRRPKGKGKGKWRRK